MRSFLEDFYLFVKANSMLGKLLSTKIVDLFDQIVLNIQNLTSVYSINDRTNTYSISKFLNAYFYLSYQIPIFYRKLCNFLLSD